MKTSEFCFKAFGTCLVLVIALSIVGWSGFSEIWPIVTIIGIGGGFALVIAIIASIWES
jgi:hypothetical protein